MSPPRLLLACALVASCGSGTGSATGSGPAPTPLPAPAAPTATAPAIGTPLVLTGHAQTQTITRFLVLDLSGMLATGAAPTPGRRFELAAAAFDGGSFTFVASQDGPDLVASARTASGGTELLHLVLGQPDVHRIDLGGLVPTAVLVSRGLAYVGAGERVGFVDLRDASLRFVEVHRRSLGSHKAFDLIVRSDDWLVAVDDEVMPMWADSFALDAAGRPSHRAGWELPGVINGTYELGALLGGGGTGTLILGAPYSIMDGHGHDLVALGIRGHALDPFPEHLTLQNAGSTPGTPPVLEEHVPRGRPEVAPTLRGGATYTEWTAMALLGGGSPTPDVVLAAGSRGLMVLPRTFSADSQATLVDTGGDCLDVVARGEALLALVGDAPPDRWAPPPNAPVLPGPSRLVLLRREGTGPLRAVTTHALDAAYDRIVH